MDSPPSRSPSLETIRFFGGVLAASLALQFSFPELIGSDGFFHLRMARDPFGPMPWMPQSIFDQGWVDHQFLFHLLMFPFALVLGGVAAAKTSAAVLAAAAITGCFAFLRTERVPGAALFAVLPGAVSWVFLLRMEMPRTQSLSLLFIVLALLALQARSLWLLLLVSWAYMASYHVALILLPMVGLYCFIHRTEPNSAGWKPLLVSGLGLSAGLTVHPHSPRTFGFLWDHVVQKVLNRDDLPVGKEWQDGLFALLSPGQGHDALRILTQSVGPLLLLAGSLLCLYLARSQRSKLAVVLFLLAAGACSGLLVASKAIEYAAPLASLSLALSLRDLAPLWLQSQTKRKALGLVIGMLLITQALILQRSVRVTEPPPDRFAPAAEFLRAHADTGEVIYHFSWGDFPELVWHAPEFRYVVGLDPHFLQLESPALWNQFSALSQCSYANPSKPIRELFEARWALVSLPWDGAEDCMAQDSDMELVFRSGGALIYRINGI
jgi:hypothetical protein